MQIHVLVEAAGGGRFVARVGEPYNWAAEGATESEAVDAVKQRVAAAKVVTVDVPHGNPWKDLAGSAKHVDPELWDEYLRAVEEYRNQVDQDEDRL